MKNKIAKLIYQSNHRGCKENDMLLSNLISKIQYFSEAEILLYEEFLSEDDYDIYRWFLTNSMPAKYLFLLQ